MKILTTILVIFFNSLTMAANPAEQCGGMDQLTLKSDAITKVIFLQNYPQFHADQVLGDGLAAPRNWYNKKTHRFYFHRGVIITGMDAENEAAFEVVFNLSNGRCELESAKMIDGLSENQ